MFGTSLGTGDYGHMTIEHASMLLRRFGSLREYSNQSIESAHSLQRQLYSKATSHDRHGYTSSSKVFRYLNCIKLTIKFTSTLNSTVEYNP